MWFVLPFQFKTKQTTKAIDSFPTSDIWASTRQNLSSGFLTKWDSNQPALLQRLARKLKFRSKQVQIWYFPIREQQRCWSAGSAPLFFAHPGRQVSSVEAHILSSVDNVCKPFGPISGLTECYACSGYKLFDTLILYSWKNFFIK